jgi:hypothetical protein
MNKTCPYCKSIRWSIDDEIIRYECGTIEIDGKFSQSDECQGIIRFYKSFQAWIDDSPQPSSTS